MEKLKIGMVGAGNIATNAHLPAYAKCHNATVVAIVDLDRSRAEEAAKKFGIPEVYDTVEEMLEKADIDAVDVCTWNNGHAPCAIAAANAGKHVMCEKPLTVSDELAEAIKEAVEKAGVKFFLAVPGRFGHKNEYLQKQVADGAFGEVFYAKTSYIRRRGTPSGWFTDKKTAGGGPVIDIGVHGIDAAWYIMGCPKPTRVSAFTSSHIGDYQTKGVGRWHGTPSPDNQFDTEDLGAGVIHFENGAMLMFEASWAINGPAHSDTQIFGSKAGADVTSATIYGERDGYLSDDRITLDDNDRFLAEITHFADCVLNDKPTRYPIEQAVTMQRILDAIYDSAEQKKEIIL
ncbi:MAG: Gfo/Idh/MocA family oxidoreductase [Clostridia bacterium]|nr:Gfo/Idh/MocA family oxidoreductase [Clostridia bacterium]